MKKVLFALSIAALALASCTEFEAETPVTFETADTPVISAEVTSDTSIKIKVEPGANTGYYAYAFVEGELDPATVNSANLIAGKLSGAIKTEVGNSAKADSLVAEIKKLTPNTKYTLVAVASSKEKQALSEVIAKTVKTTDETIPEIVLANYDVEVAEDTSVVFYVPFDDPIALTDTATFVAMTYAKNYDSGAAGYYLLKPLKQILVPAENVALDKDGHTVVVTVPADGYAPGAYMALFVAEGSVVNELGAVNETFEDNYIILRGSYAGTFEGLLAQYEPKPFDFECSVAEDSVVKFQSAAAVEIELIPQCEGLYNELATYGDGDVIATAVHSVSGRKVEYTLEEWDVNAAGNVWLGLDETPDFGCYVTYSVEAGIVEDLYGNTNNALVIEDVLFCSYGYTKAAVLGTYNFTYSTYYGVDGAESGIVIAPSDDKDYDLMIYDMFQATPCFDDLVGYSGGYTPNDFTKLYADFDPDSGVLTVYGDQIGVGNYKGTDYPACAFGEGEDNEFLFVVPAPGNILLNDTVYMYLYGLGSWDYVVEGALTRTALTYDYTEPAPAPSTVKKPAAKNLKKLVR